MKSTANHPPVLYFDQLTPIQKRRVVAHHKDNLLWEITHYRAEIVSDFPVLDRFPADQIHCLLDAERLCRTNLSLNRLVLSVARKLAQEHTVYLPDGVKALPMSCRVITGKDYCKPSCQIVGAV